MMAIGENAKPALAAGCRWGGSKEQPVLLFPEGAIKVQATGLAILQLCDGQRSFSEIVSELQERYPEAPAKRIREESANFLEQLNAKRIVNL
ncbi:MAG TPA: pyrroloquinoline quinone biosynthesis peptide chaperone PqqD [Dongiaceae bacterium]|nr:pyrroloquinoline quinone biosynthesis peptide chaperone PqqD [Dongiaceae bacterium]